MRRFSAVVLGENREALGLFNSFGDVRREYAAGVVELVIELPPKRGIGARLARALREAAAENLSPAQARAGRDAKIGEFDAKTTESSGGESSHQPWSASAVTAARYGVGERARDRVPKYSVM